MKKTAPTKQAKQSNPPKRKAQTQMKTAKEIAKALSETKPVKAVKAKPTKLAKRVPANTWTKDNPVEKTIQRGILRKSKALPKLKAKPVALANPANRNPRERKYTEKLNMHIDAALLVKLRLASAKLDCSVSEVIRLCLQGKVKNLDAFLIRNA